MHALALSSLALLAGSATAKMCRNITVPVDISARTAVFDNIDTPMTNLDPTTFILNQTRQGQNFTDQALTGYATTAGRYNIDAKFCVPNNESGNNPVVQVLTHGIGFDKTYWDLPYNNFNYSYIDTAVDDYGYCTLSYDRLGIGRSDHGEPKNEIQSFLEVEAIAAITRQLRNGTLPTVNNSFDRVVHVGHSFGSAQSYALSALYPDLSDGLILTGFSLNGSFVSLFGAGANFQQARLNQPLRFAGNSTQEVIASAIRNYALVDLIAPLDVTTSMPYDYQLGYLTNANANSQQYLFFYPPFFDEGILYYGEATKQPVTIGELLTLASLPMSSSFSGPVLVVTGSNDLPYCGGDCLATGGAAASIPAGVGAAFPSASNFEAYIQPQTGHGINFHYNATGAYNVINTYLGSHGLMPGTE